MQNRNNDDSKNYHDTEKLNNITDGKYIHDNLNAAQKNLIAGALNLVFSLTAKFDPFIVINAFEAIISESIFDSKIEKLKTDQIWSEIKYIRAIPLHPCPQNCSEGDYTIEQPSDQNWVAYHDSNGKQIVEQRGCWI